MNTRRLAVMAALVAATTARAQSGGSAADPAESGASRDSASQAAAQQQAPSVTSTEGPGGSSPRPVTQGQGENRRFGNEPAATPGITGRRANEPGRTGASQNQVSGRVALVNPSEREIAIDAGTATMQFKVAPDAKITIDGEKASFEDIAKGAEVRASLDRSGGEFQAKRLEVTSTGKK
ncbi:hypothetical protein [Anaeromyxobacter sp. Fw109-5]|uniref:hypothetical protein n=1 Tax=Anaeromyxobacter sp. (strain Fw109-5) TaxID=404589 RepID=UPI0000ED77BD|nr:hypothetical protein [Anaeromyxobacter sp. Fw109-5]ABS24702.1 conserved hypothetical protein [Anaeromyxobacter sp. Fw109-5]